MEKIESVENYFRQSDVKSLCFFVHNCQNAHKKTEKYTIILQIDGRCDRIKA